MVDTPIGIDSPDYTLVTADLGTTIYCKVTATNSVGSANANSNTVGPVAAAPSTGSTWNPADKFDVSGEAVIEFSNGNRTVTTRYLGGGVHPVAVRGTVSHGSGKWYFEAKMNMIPYAGFIGLDAAADALTDVDDFPGINNSHGFVVNTDNDALVGQISYNASAGSYDVTPDVAYAVNGVWGFAIDFDTRTAYFRYNGTWLGPGDPVAGTGGLSWGATPTALFPYCVSKPGADPTAITTIATTDSQFANAAPTGFTAWG
jgi:hypothetical protein